MVVTQQETQAEPDFQLLIAYERGGTTKMTVLRLMSRSGDEKIIET